jgi:hypothetical protein
MISLIVFAVVVVLAVIAFIVKARRRLGVRVLTESAFLSELKALLDKTLAERKAVPGLGGILVIRVPEPCWRDAVLEVLSRSAVAIVDVSELTPNLAWELTAALQKLPPEKIILAYRAPETGDRCSDPGLLSSITDLVGETTLAKLKLLPYPEALGKRRFYLPGRNFTDDFGLTIQKCLAD